MIIIKVDDKQVLDMLAELARRCHNLEPAMRKIGDAMVDSTKLRFASATDPDGELWAKNSTETTIPFYLAAMGGAYKKDGNLRKRGVALRGFKKPLTGESKALQTTINYQLNGPNSVQIGSPMEYAAMQQFGGITSPRSMIPGKTIPPRRFLGMSAADRVSILDIVGSYLVQ